MVRGANMYELFMTTYSIVLTALCGYVVHNLKEDKKRKQAQGDALCALLRDRLIDLHDKVMERESITVRELEAFKGMYRAYRALGGNGVVEHMDKDIEKLPIEN